MRIRRKLLMLTTLLLSTHMLAAENVDPLKDAFALDTGKASRAVAVLKEKKDRETLQRVVKEAKITVVKAAAVGALGEVGDFGSARFLLEILDLHKGEVAEGGTEQRMENDMMRRALVAALSKLCEVPQPSAVSEKTVESFGTRCKEKLQEVQNKHD